MNKIFLLPTILLLGCNAGLELTVKPPIHQACESSKLKGCDEITSGVLTFIEGDKVNGTKMVVAGAAKNEPGQIQVFAKMLAKLSDTVPGIPPSIGEIAHLLAGDAPKPQKNVLATTNVPILPASNGWQPKATPTVIDTPTVIIAPGQSASVEVSACPIGWLYSENIYRCISICNPSCKTGEICNSDRTCVVKDPDGIP